MLTKKIAFNILLVCSLPHCATDQAAKVRDTKPATVGIWGGGYRPNSKAGVVANLGGLVSKETHYAHNTDEGKIKSGKGDAPRSQNITTADEQKVDLGLHLYPLQTSAFFYGVGLERKNRLTRFDAHTRDSSLVEPKYANVGYQDQIISVGPAIGWDWIWPNGVSVLTDFGPRWEVSKSRSYNSTGENENVDKDQRDKLVKKLDNSSGMSIISGRAIVGYSF